MAYRLGVDVGGTFTDLLMIENISGKTYRTKVPSTPHDPSEAVISGAQRLCKENNIDPGEIEMFLHGTTVATNAILEGKGARVGLIVTEGYRQLLQIARSYVPGGLAAWIIWPKPEPLAPLECTIEVPERIGADGEIVRPLDEDALRKVLPVLKAEGVEAITICLINSYVNDAHECRVAEICAEELPDIPVSISAHILPEMQEYERALTTVVNSSVRVTVARYVQNLRQDLNKLKMKGKLNLLRSDGGLMSSEKSEEAPVNLLMSGPAGGVAGAVWVAKHAGFENILTLDMGGTSTDVALIENGQPRLRRYTTVGGLTGIHGRCLAPGSRDGRIHHWWDSGDQAERQRLDGILGSPVLALRSSGDVLGPHGCACDIRSLRGHQSRNHASHRLDGWGLAVQPGGPRDRQRVSGC